MKAKSIKSLVSILLVTLMLMSAFAETVSAEQDSESIEVKIPVLKKETYKTQVIDHLETETYEYETQEIDHWETKTIEKREPVYKTVTRERKIPIYKNMTIKMQLIDHWEPTKFKEPVFKTVTREFKKPVFKTVTKCIKKYPSGKDCFEIQVIDHWETETYETQVIDHWETKTIEKGKPVWKTETIKIKVIDYWETKPYKTQVIDHWETKTIEEWVPVFKMETVELRKPVYKTETIEIEVIDHYETIIVPKAQGKIIKRAAGYVGYGDEWEGKTHGFRFDCSGFTEHVLKNVNIKIKGNASDQYKYCKNHNLISQDPKHGDLVFFELDTDPQIDHVGIYIGDGKMIHVSYSTRMIRVEEVEDVGEDVRYGRVIDP